MTYFKSFSILLALMASLPLQLQATPIPREGAMSPDASQNHASAAPGISGASGQPAILTPVTSSITSTSSEVINLLAGDKLEGIGNVAGNDILSNDKGNNLASGNSLVGDVNLLGEQSKSTDTTATYTTLINSGKMMQSSCTIMLM